MSDSFVEEEFIGSIAVLRFCRPAQRNTLTSETLNRLSNLLTTLGETSAPVVILTGTEDAFLSGADISELRDLDPESAVDFSRKGQAITSALANLQAVTIAAVNGFCMGGGLDLALACDVRIASKSAVFAHPGARLGIITGWGGTQRLPRLIGRSRAIDFFATARRVTADEALQMGLVTQVHDPVIDAALELASRVISTS